MKIRHYASRMLDPLRNVAAAHRHSKYFTPLAITGFILGGSSLYHLRSELARPRNLYELQERIERRGSETEEERRVLEDIYSDN